MSEQIAALNNVSWKHNGQQILENVDWHITKGQHWALVGNNGSGKTSLLNVINGYIFPTRGTASVLGHQFGQTSLQDMRREIGWVSSSLVDKQQSGHPEDTVREVVVSGCHSSIGIYRDVSQEDWELASQAMRQFRCAHFADRPFHSLSQGEKQRVILARAMVRQPRMLILDEPCTGLDLATREELLQLLETIIQEQTNLTLIYVTHHIDEILPSISHVLTLKDGSVVAAGAKQEVLTDKILAATFGIPVRVSWTGNRPWLQVTQ